MLGHCCSHFKRYLAYQWGSNIWCYDLSFFGYDASRVLLVLATTVGCCWPNLTLATAGGWCWPNLTLATAGDWIWQWETPLVRSRQKIRLFDTSNWLWVLLTEFDTSNRRRVVMTEFDNGTRRRVLVFEHDTSTRQKVKFAVAPAGGRTAVVVGEHCTVPFSSTRRFWKFVRPMLLKICAAHVVGD